MAATRATQRDGPRCDNAKQLVAARFSALEERGKRMRQIGNLVMHPV
jgi:hypothetical protein